MKKIATLLIGLIILSVANAQTDSIVNAIIKTDSIVNVILKTDTIKVWKKGGLGALNFSQSSFTNWAAGGENALSATALLNVFANYKKDKNTWDNTLDLAYGLLQSSHSAVRKNEDKIDFSSKYGRYAFLEHWYYTALVNFKTQFDNGYNYPDDSTVISHFMAPAYVLVALGMDYKTIDNSFSVFISPLTSKTTIVNNQRLADAGAFGVEKARYDSVAGIYVMVEHGNMVRTEFGGYLKMTFKKDIAKNVNFSTKLELFSNYLDRPENIDVNWEILIGMKVNNFLTASISTQMIYDHDIPVPVVRDVNGVQTPGAGPRLQFKEVLAIGISYKF
ncbi:MAG: DUF3078 domain-containing protein [Bacteroidetes bacterium]|nr:DUF3078 domain-containing protein [Bacteroidota bacterium]